MSRIELDEFDRDSVERARQYITAARAEKFNPDPVALAHRCGFLEATVLILIEILDGEVAP